MLGNVNIYYIWYGNWSVDPNAINILQNFASFIGGSPYFAINTTYYDFNATHVSNAVTYVLSTTDNYSQGAVLTDSAVVQIVSSALTDGRLPTDTNGVYFVLTSPDVRQLSGFCGWHDSGTIAGADIKFAWIGNFAAQGARCSAQTGSSPNGDPPADAMALVIAHELEESVTDPHFSAWYDSSFEEVADKCEWTYGQTYAATNGSLANMNLGGYDYLIQQNWVNVAGGYCALNLTNPGLITIDPDGSSANTSVEVTMTGNNLSGASINAIPGVTISNVVAGGALLTATFAIAAGASLGGRSVTVTTANGTSNAMTFTVNPPGPSLTAISPSSGGRGASVPVTISGSDLSGASINAISGVTISNVVSSDTQVTATFGVAANASPGGRSVTVTTANGTSNAVTFTVNPPGPSLIGISPSSGGQGASVTVTISGASLSGASINAISGVTISNVFSSATQISSTFAIDANASLGGRNVTVATANGTSNAMTFTVNPPGPSLTGISPNSGEQGSSVPVTINGSNLSGAAINVGGGITVSGVSSTGSQVTAAFNIPANATPGAVGVIVSTAGGISNPVTFTVTGAVGPPTLSSVSPSGAPQGGSANVTITGTNFVAGAAILAPDVIAVSNTVVVSSTQITATFTMASTASRRSTFTLTTPRGQSNSLNFEVMAPSPSTTLSSISPSSGGQGSSVPVTIGGSNLSGATINSIPGVTISTVVSSAAQVTAVFAIAANASPGGRSVTVTTANGTSNAVTFTVNPPGPSLIGISPSSGGQGASATVTISGSNLSGASINAIPGVTISNSGLERHASHGGVRHRGECVAGRAERHGNHGQRNEQRGHVHGKSAGAGSVTDFDQSQQRRAGRQRDGDDQRQQSERRVD